jgi:hypothetical protein
MSKQEGPVFVVGVNGSGTTMLSDALGRHPDLYMLPTESRMLPFFARRHADAALVTLAQRRALADTLGTSRAFWLVNDRKPLVLPDVELTAPGFAGVVSAVYLHLARREGKPRWGDKSPMYLQHMELLAERFPDARFIHIYRDARDAAQSFHRRWKQEPRRNVYRWKQAIRIGRRQGARLGPERYMELSYEELTGDAESGLHRVSDFLGLTFHPAMLEAGTRMMDAGSREAAQGRIVRNSGRWKNYFTEAQVFSQERIAGALLDELGYEVALKGDENPAKITLLWWKGMDRARLVQHHLQTRGVKGWKGLLMRTKDALRQDDVNEY